MYSDKDGTDPYHPGEASIAARERQLRHSEFSVPLQGYDFTDIIVAGQKEAGVMLSNSGSDSFFLKGFPWAAAQTSLLFVLGLLLMTALGFIWKLHWEKQRELQIKEKLQRELNWREAQSYADTGKGRSQRSQANVTLDPDAAHLELSVSEDLQSVKRKNIQQDLPEKPGRFFLDPCVLGHEGFSSGRHYWEVEVGDRAYWELGVCEENIQTTWGVTELPQNGFWAVELYANKFQALTSPWTLLPLSEPLSWVGIFLDYEAGDVSFSNVSDRSHIFTFPRASFSGALRPFFCLWFYHPTPLTVCH